MIYHEQKIKDEIHRLASEFIERESNRNTLITVTNVYITKELKKAIIWISISKQTLNYFKLMSIKTSK